MARCSVRDDKSNNICLTLPCSGKKVVLTLELSSYVLEIPNDADQTLSQNLAGCSTLSQE